MKKVFFILAAGSLIALTLWFFYGRENQLVACENQDLAIEDTLQTISLLPDTSYESINELIYQIDVFDTITSGELSSFEDLYADIPGILTFRGSPTRKTPFYGEIENKPSKVTVEWVFTTDYDAVQTDFGVWGGGTGWTGQPLYIPYSDSLKNTFLEKSPGLTTAFSGEEIIIGSLAGYVYFIDYQTGKASRQSINVHNPIKGTPSLDPSFNGNLYVGQGIPREKPFGALVINLYSHKQVQFFPEDKNAWRGWGAYDSSPIAVGEFLFRCGENGTVYKFLREEQGLKLHSTLRYKVKGKNAPGIESSPAIYKNYGYITDNHGNIICFNLNTLQPVWRYNNYDDTDGSPVVEVENDIPFIYTGCEIDKQGTEGQSHFVKLNGLTGEKIWEQKISGKRKKDGEKWSDGGMFSTPLIGMKDCDSMIFSNFCIHTATNKADLIAFNKYNGNIIYRTALKQYAWSSPIAICNKNDEMFIFTGDIDGAIYLIQGKTGEIILRQPVGNNFEGSPIIIGNSVVVGSRGREIYKLKIE